MAGLPKAIAEVSYSRLSSFDGCSRQFWHAYVDRTPPDGYDRIEGFMGSTVHKVLEWSLRQVISKQVPDPTAILEKYEAEWDAAWGENVLITKAGLGPDHYREIGRRCLNTHLAKEWPFLEHQPVLIEEPVEFPVALGGGASRFIGIVDRVDLTKDGTVRVIDYKTGAWVPNFDDPAEARQLALYWHALKPRFPTAERALLVWQYLQREETKRVEASRQVVGSAVEWVEKTGKRIEARLAKSDAKSNFPATPGPLCRWCEFGYVCDANPFRSEAPRPLKAARTRRLDEFGAQGSKA